MMHPLRAIATVVGFAAVTATSGLALLTPHVTHADGEDRRGTFTSGVVYAYASLEKDDTAKNGWKIVLTTDNPTDGDANEDVDVSVLYAVSNPSSRVGAPGTAVWRHKEHVALAAHAKGETTLECPASIARAMTALERAQEKRDAMIQSWQDKGDVPQWVWSKYYAPRGGYWVEAAAKVAPQPKAGVPSPAGRRKS